MCPSVRKEVVCMCQEHLLHPTESLFCFIDIEIGLYKSDLFNQCKEFGPLSYSILGPLFASSLKVIRVSRFTLGPHTS